jgi:DtxR family Mn-dependent transcriptional regulator
MALKSGAGIRIVYGLLFTGVLVWMFWPSTGIWARLKRGKINNQRVILEDALKFLFDCEYRKHPCELSSLAGNLSVSMDKASRLVEKLLRLGLINLENQNIALTDTGRSYALRVIRVHRIWERYLADETGIAQADWHNEADRIEHEVTPEATEILAAQMGNPVYDPHGDPIPSVAGNLPENRGIPLSRLQEGDFGRIIHIEDEPKSIYEQLIVEGLYPGMTLYVTDVAENRITFATDGDECVLTPLFASHIAVEPLVGKLPATGKQISLSSLQIGQTAEVTGISPNCRGQQRRRLMDLGIVPGTQITAELKSASGDPTAYRILGTTIGIRKQQAELIFITSVITYSHENE